ncbi:hypothetical protein IQ13_4168 [Lacibacter cauensis]|uniref:Uncharacterized protein n=1 Tax=Lacibacter cauensis TaxID=510947 RepID=A0A562S940_9BACT|nr:hypothetical protein [Lacibacter cauensis]TWI77927.1 hypothetical protein IQ13_4168 [Lacibacter cauensis]
MNTFLLIAGLLVAAVIFFAVYRLITVKRQGRKLNAERFERVKALYDKLESGQPLTGPDVLPFAENVLTRELTYQLLSDYKRTDLFPEQYYTIVQAAESNLANWLEFPTELDACPDEMKHVQRVSIDFDGQHNFVHYEVFRCRVNEPHWAAKDGWFLGVVGPYFDDSKPYDFPHATFSRISSKADQITAEEEAMWVHQNISMRR